MDHMSRCRVQANITNTPKGCCSFCSSSRTPRTPAHNVRFVRHVRLPVSWNEAEQQHLSKAIGRLFSAPGIVTPMNDDQKNRRFATAWGGLYKS